MTCTQSAYHEPMLNAYGKLQMALVSSLQGAIKAPTRKGGSFTLAESPKTKPVSEAKGGVTHGASHMAV